MTKTCPCGSNRHFRECCAMIIDGNKEAATCEELMRSRYVAFTMAHVNYLMCSQHTRTRRPEEAGNIRKWAKSVQWMGLVILETQKGGVNDHNGVVKFRALFMEAGQMRQIYEKSLFERENGKWVYVSGVHL